MGNIANETVANGVGEEQDGLSQTRRESFSALLRCGLNGSELVERARSMAVTRGTIKSLEDELKAAQATIKARIAENEARLEVFSQAVQNGWEMRSVECARLFDFKQRRVTEIRLDGLDPYVVSERRMTDQEAQSELPLD